MLDTVWSVSMGFRRTQGFVEPSFHSGFYLEPIGLVNPIDTS